MENNNWARIKAPIVLSSEEWAVEKVKEEYGYLFYTQMINLERIIDSFTSQLNEKDTEPISKNIGILGDRGTGKTSLAKTLENHLRSEGYYIFDMVDPSVFEQHLNILEILISNIYGIINRPGDKHARSDEGQAHHRRTEILMDLKKLTKTLANERHEDSFFKEKNPPIEVLDEIQNRLQLDKIITDVLHKTSAYLKMQGKHIKDFVLIVDDIDLLDNTTSSNLIHDIQKYLDTKLVIILAYRESQLQLSLLDERVKEYNDLLFHQAKTFNEEIVTLEELSLQNTKLPLIPLSFFATVLSFSSCLSNLLFVSSR